MRYLGRRLSFYERLNQILDEKTFDEYVETMCERFHADEVGRLGVAPGTYFRLPIADYFEEIDSERGIAGQRQLVDPVVRADREDTRQVPPLMAGWVRNA